MRGLNLCLAPRMTGRYVDGRRACGRLFSWHLATLMSKYIYSVWLKLCKVNIVSHEIMINTVNPVISGRSKIDKMGLDATKPVFGVSDKARLKSVSSPTETS